MRKKLLCFIMTVSLLLSLIPTVSSALGIGLDNFVKTKTYEKGQFNDVDENAWYSSSVKAGYEYGLLLGNGNGTFNVTGNITVAETIALACRLHNIFNGGNGIFPTEKVWYQPYVDYALKNGIIKSDQFDNYSGLATRAQFAQILAAAFPDEAYTEINTINDIPDVSSSIAYCKDLLNLYRAGILVGSDTYGTFYPDNHIVRTEVAAIITRMADPSLRKKVDFKKLVKLDYDIEKKDFSEKITSEDGTLTITQYFELVKIVGDSEIASKINKSLQEDLELYKESLTKKSEFLDDFIPAYVGEEFFYTVDSEIIQNKNDIFSIKSTINRYEGRGYILNTRGEAFSISTGDKLSLAEYLGITESEVENNVVYTVMKAVEEDPSKFYNDDSNDLMVAILDDYSFYVENNQVYICYDIFTIGPRASGCFVFKLLENPNVYNTYF